MVGFRQQTLCAALDVSLQHGLCLPLPLKSWLEQLALASRSKPGQPHTGFHASSEKVA